MKYLLYDVSNMLYRTFFANKKLDAETSIGLAHHMALLSANKFFRKFNPHKLVMVFDRSSWRKEYTQSSSCISGKVYKSHRRKDMSPKEQEKFFMFLQHITEFEEIIRNHTGIVCLSKDGLEADDLIAGFIEAYAPDGDDEIVIVSRDRDLAQMLGNGKDIFYSNVSQYDPTTGKQITIESAIRDLFKSKRRIELSPNHMNVDYFLFAKCMKGDFGDHIQGALPGVRKTKIDKAYNNSLERLNIMNEVWTDNNLNEFKVKNLFEENKKLIDLRSQPEEIRVKIFNAILDAMETPGKFNYFHFLRFLGKNDLKEIEKSLESMLPMLDC